MFSDTITISLAALPAVGDAASDRWSVRTPNNTASPAADCTFPQ